MQERLQKVLARAGVASRRQAETLIVAGRVKVNHQIVTQLGTKVDEKIDFIEVDNRKITVKEKKVYILLHKPLGYVTTLKDPQGRKKVADLVRDLPQRVYPVGRLDFNTEGLLLMTNDGEFAYRLAHPRFKVEKTYLAKVVGIPTGIELRTLRKGVLLDDGKTAPAIARIVSRLGPNTLLEIKIREGRKHQIRRMCLAISHPVMQLKRTHISFLGLDQLPLGHYRHLTAEELMGFQKMFQGLNLISLDEESKR